MASTVIQDFLIAIGIDVDQTKLNKVLDKFGDFKDTLATLATGTGLGLVLQQVNKITQSIVEATQATSQWAIDLDRTARKTGINANVLQRLRMIEKERGIDEGTTESAIENIYSKQAQWRARGQYDEGFLRASRYGISLNKGDPAKVLADVIDKVSKLPEALQKQVMSDLSLDMSLLDLKGADISKIDSSFLISDEDKNKLKDINKEFGTLQNGLKAIKDKFIISMLPLVRELLETANKKIKEVIKKIEEIKKDKELMAKITRFLTNTKTILAVIGSIAIPVIVKSLMIIGKFLLTGILSPLGSILKLVLAIGKAGAIASWFSIFGKAKDVMDPKKLSLFAKAFRGIGLAINVVAKGFLKLTASILTNPITWLIAGVTSLAVILGDLLNVATGGEATTTRWLENVVGKYFPSVGKGLKWLRENIEGFYDSAKEFFGGLYDLCGGIKDLILQILAELWKKFKSYISDSVDYVINKYKEVKAFLKNLNPFGSKEEIGAIDKKILELEAKAKKKEDAKRFREIQPMVTQLMTPTIPQMMSKGGVSENNYTINSTNNFTIEDAKDPAQVATQVGNIFNKDILRRDLQKASLGYGNGGR